MRRLNIKCDLEPETSLTIAMTPEQTARYVEITDPEFIAAAFAENLPTPPVFPVVENLNVIG